ncbi:MAG: hypothetical protein KGY99_11325 [Phycisphaerae bacterium]|nr:hypothetical protein [Phycisphaerae bacterium]
MIECWLKDSASADAGHSDFWVASPKGMFYLLRGHAEDCLRGREPGTVLDVSLPAWRVGECLLHAQRMATALGDPLSEILFQVVWYGLANRTLVSIGDRRFMTDDDICVEPTVASPPCRVPAKTISDTLPEIVGQATGPLYAAFNFFEPPASLFSEEMKRMRSGRP